MLPKPRTQGPIPGQGTRSHKRQLRVHVPQLKIPTKTPHMLQLKILRAQQRSKILHAATKTQRSQITIWKKYIIKKTSIPGYTKCTSLTYLNGCKCIKYSFPESWAYNGVTVIDAKKNGRAHFGCFIFHQLWNTLAQSRNQLKIGWADLKEKVESWLKV